MTTVHLVPSGFDKTFCGLNADKVKHTSLGLATNCDKCYSKAQSLLNAHNKG